MIKGKHIPYPNEEVVDDFERKHILEIRPSVTLAKNVIRKDLVFALLNREIIEAMWGQLIKYVRVMFEGAIYSYRKTQNLVLFQRAFFFKKVLVWQKNCSML